MLLESEGRGQLRCEGKWLCEGPLDEGEMLREGTWLCEGLLDEGECFARVYWTRATSLRGSSTTL